MEPAAPCCFERSSISVFTSSSDLARSLSKVPQRLRSDGICSVFIHTPPE
jgi:hypothetical protein